jgi:hypothetical protein
MAVLNTNAIRAPLEEHGLFFRGELTTVVIAIVASASRYKNVRKPKFADMFESSVPLAYNPRRRGA